MKTGRINTLIRSICYRQTRLFDAGAVLTAREHAAACRGGSFHGLRFTATSAGGKDKGLDAGAIHDPEKKTI